MKISSIIGKFRFDNLNYIFSSESNDRGIALVLVGQLLSTTQFPLKMLQCYNYAITINNVKTINCYELYNDFLNQNRFEYIVLSQCSSYSSHYNLNNNNPRKVFIALS